MQDTNCGVLFRVQKVNKIGFIGLNGADMTTITKIPSGKSQPKNFSYSGSIGYLLQDQSRALLTAIKNGDDQRLGLVEAKERLIKPRLELASKWPSGS